MYFLVLMLVAAAPSVAELREQVRPVTAAACAPCHVGGDAEAKPAAIAVFDVKAPEWTSKLDARRRGVFLGRIKGKLEAPQLALVQAWLDAESRPQSQRL